MSSIKWASLDSIKAMKTAGERHDDSNASVGREELRPDYWANAIVSGPKDAPHSVHLRLDPEVSSEQYPRK